MSTKGLTRREFLRIATVTGVGVAVGACAPAVQPTTAPTAAPAVVPTKAPAPGPTPTVGPQTGGVLRVSLLWDAERLGYPSTMQSQNDPLYAHPAVENLVRFDETGAVAPMLATSWQTDTKAMTVTFTLRTGVKFHDGTEFDAAAAKWNLEQYRTTSKKGELAAVKSIDVVNDSTLRLNLSRLDSLLIVNLALIAGLMVSPTAFQKAGADDKARIAWCEKNPVGTGPFKFASWQKDVKITYQKWDSYWQKGKPYLDGIEFIAIADPMVQRASFERGEVDVISNLDPQNAKDLEASGKYKITKGNVPTGTYVLVGDSAHPESPYAKLQVRQAVSYAIDTDAIATTIGRGYYLSLHQFAPKGSWAYNPDVQGYPYNPDKAKQLLKDAGYPNGFKTTLMVQNVAPLPDVITAVQGFLSKVGIDATIDLLDQARAAKIVTGGPTEGGWRDGMFLVPFTPTPNEFGPWNRLLSREVHAARFPSLYMPDELMDYIAEAVAAPDDNAMKAAVYKLAKAESDKYCMGTWMYALPSINAKQVRVNDDGIQVRTHWNPGGAWLGKGA